MSDSPESGRKPAAIANPCVEVCTLDWDDICLGCFRSMDEICAWYSMTDDEKRAVLRKAEERSTQPRPRRPE